MSMSFFEFFILAFASFRLTRLLVYDKITEFIRLPFYDKIVEKNDAGYDEIYYIPTTKFFLHHMGVLFSCHWCIGIWNSVILVTSYQLYPSFVTPIILILGIAGVGATIESIIQFINNH
jgi:Protein of unknown function (DUF1360)